MSEPLRSDQLIAQARTDAERDAKIESLLLTGLDHYFSADYTQAIDVWTRALFLDRNHARARAYIERARSALAEQQRESEEMLHSGIAAFERGEMEAARQLLNAAVQRGGAHDVALAFLTRIDRIIAATPLSAPAPAAHEPQVALEPRPRSTSHALVLATGAALSVAALVYVFSSFSWVRELVPGFRPAMERSAAGPPAVQEPLLVPRSADAALDRARALFAGGHAHDALRALDLIRPTDDHRADADRLRETIQRALLADESGGSRSVAP